LTVSEDALAVARVKASGAVILGKTNVPFALGSGELERGVASLPGLPATVLPIGASPAGLPIGAQVIGPTFEDRTPIHFAELVKRHLGGFTPPPLD
jgi:Asp-tRNA(Asn)/Glu-tRNA(Gln) amidotransferase A subunit family amidase